MSKYYTDKQNDEKVEAIKVTEPWQKVETTQGEIVVTKGNYIVKYDSGAIIGVRADEFAVFYAKAK